MANTTTAANAASPATTPVLTIGNDYTISVTGFTYVREYALIKGKVTETGESCGVIIGDKMSFGMSDMFQLKNSNGIVARYTKDKIVNGVSYKQFSLQEILF